jgi:glycosyltransferase involved in cell wall biosynthesis
MHIILIHLIDFPVGGAGSAHARLMVKGLRENGENVALVIPHPLAIGSAPGKPGLKGCDGGVPFLHMGGITARSKNPLRRFVQNYRGVFRTARLLRRRRKRKKLDAVILSTPDTFKYLPIILTCMIRRIPIFVWAVEKMSLEEAAGGLHGMVKRLGHLLSEHGLPRCADGYLVISSRLEQHYRRYLPERQVLVSPILVDPEPPPTNAPPTRFTWEDDFPGKSLLVYSGTFAEKDGLGVIIEAFARVVASRPEARLVLTGSGHPRHMVRVEKQIERLNLGSHCHVSGFLPPESLRHLQNSAALLLACRTRSRFAQHGFPWKLGEYCMTGRPVLATDVGDVGKYFEDGKDIYLAQPDDPGSIAAAVISILSNPEAAERVGRTGKKAAIRHFHYLPQCERIAEFIHTNLAR